MHCQQLFAVVVQQAQANTLAQLGSSPSKPHLRVTADPATPSDGSENGSILERKTITFCFPSPNIKKSRESKGFPVDQEPLVPSLSAFSFNQSFKTCSMVSKCTISYSENKQPQCSLNILRGFLYQSSLLCSHLAEGNHGFMLKSGGGHSMLETCKFPSFQRHKVLHSIYSASYWTRQPRRGLSVPSRG